MKLTPENTAKIRKFASHCMKELGLRGPIHVKLSKKQTGMATAGYYNPETNTIFVATHNRATADIMRTLAHELTHARQKQNGAVFPSDDEGLQPLEDEANTMSGRLVRFYGRANRDIYGDLVSEGVIKQSLFGSNTRDAPTPFAVFVVAQLQSGLYAATTRAADRGEAGKIGLPGGKVDPGEDPVDAAKREAHEEGWAIDTVLPEVFHSQVRDGKLIQWYRGVGARKLSQYKEQGRITPIAVTREQVLGSGYGNGNLRLDP